MEEVKDACVSLSESTLWWVSCQKETWDSPVTNEKICDMNGQNETWMFNREEVRKGRTKELDESHAQKTDTSAGQESGRSEVIRASFPFGNSLCMTMRQRSWAVTVPIQARQHKTVGCWFYSEQQ